MGTINIPRTRGLAHKHTRTQHTHSDLYFLGAAAATAAANIEQLVRPNVAYKLIRKIK